MARGLIIFFSGLIFLLLPWYCRDRGSLQPVDGMIFFSCIFFYYFSSGIMNVLYGSKIFRIFLSFSIYTISILIFDYIIETNIFTVNLIWKNLYYIFLVIFFLTMLMHVYSYNSEKFYNLMLILLLIHCVIPIYICLTSGSITGRTSLSFNDPNQLGFFTLVNMSIFFYVSLLALNQDIVIKKTLSLIVINLNLFFLFLSASRSSLPVILLYGLSYLIIFRFKFRKNEFLFFYILIGILLFLITFIVSYMLFHYIEGVRPGSLQTEPTTGLQKQFLMRAVEGLDFSLWGILFGNGSLSNAARYGYGLEFHNNFSSIFNQIGLLGLLFYIYMNAIIIMKLYRKGFLYTIPYFCYLFYSNFTYSYRIRYNWLFLAVIIFVLSFDNICFKYPKARLAFRKPRFIKA